LEIKVLNIIDARCNHEVYYILHLITLYYLQFWNSPISTDLVRQGRERYDAMWSWIAIW